MNAPTTPGDAVRTLRDAASILRVVDAYANALRGEETHGFDALEFGGALTLSEELDELAAHHDAQARPADRASDGADADTAECSAYPNLGRCTHVRCLLRERNRLGAAYTQQVEHTNFVRAEWMKREREQWARAGLAERALDAARADTARLDWLQAHGESVGWIDPSSGDANACHLVYSLNEHEPQETGGGDIREAIDAARQESGS